MRRKAWRWTISLCLLIAVFMLALFPLPVSWSGRGLGRGEHVRAIGSAYCVLHDVVRPSRVPVNAFTYTVNARRYGADQIEVVVLPRVITQDLFAGRDAEEIHIILDRASMKVVRYSFAQ